MITMALEFWHCRGEVRDPDGARRGPPTFWPVPGMVQADVETPQTQRGETLIRVHAVGVTCPELSCELTTHN
jgi:hypothetical protein